MKNERLEDLWNGNTRLSEVSDSEDSDDSESVSSDSWKSWKDYFPPESVSDIKNVHSLAPSDHRSKITVTWIVPGYLRRSVDDMIEDVLNEHSLYYEGVKCLQDGWNNRTRYSFQVWGDTDQLIQALLRVQEKLELVNPGAYFYTRTPHQNAGGR